jgi:hypothetical protein
LKKNFLGIVFLVLTVVAFVGVVSAVPTVDYSYTDENGNEISEIQAGDTLGNYIEVENDETPVSDVTVTTVGTTDINNWGDSTDGLESRDNGQTWTQATITYPTADSFTWTIGSLAANENIILRWYSYPLSAGYSTETSNLYVGERMVDNDAATIIVTEPESNSTSDLAGETTTAAAGTVGMQETGSPVGLLLLAFGLLSTGLVYSRKQ